MARSKSIGWLPLHDSLLRDGLLAEYGSLTAPGFLIVHVLAFLLWLSQSSWLSDKFIGSEGFDN